MLIIYLNIIASSPVLCSPAPGLITHPPQQPGLFVRVVQTHQITSKNFTLLLSFNPANTAIRDVEAPSPNLIKLWWTISWGN